MATYIGESASQSIVHTSASALAAGRPVQVLDMASNLTTVDFYYLEACVNHLKTDAAGFLAAVYAEYEKRYTPAQGTKLNISQIGGYYQNMRSVLDTISPKSIQPLTPLQIGALCFHDMTVLAYSAWKQIAEILDRNAALITQLKKSYYKFYDMIYGPYMFNSTGFAMFHRGEWTEEQIRIVQKTSVFDAVKPGNLKYNPFMNNENYQLKILPNSSVQPQFSYFNDLGIRYSKTGIGLDPFTKDSPFTAPPPHVINSATEPRIQYIGYLFFPLEHVSFVDTDPHDLTDYYDGTLPELATSRQTYPTGYKYDLPTMYTEPENRMKFGPLIAVGAAGIALWFMTK